MLRKSQRRIPEIAQNQKNQSQPIGNGVSTANQNNVVSGDDNTQLLILNLLQNINQQLAELQTGANSSDMQQFEEPSQQQQSQTMQQPPQQQQSQTMQQSSGLQLQPASQPLVSGNEQNQLSQQLQDVFSQLLLSKNDKQSAGQMNQANSEPPSQSNQSSGQSQPEQGQASQDVTKLKKLTVQTASQVLSQAQYELANELEVSLKKLKQVISESEKIANKISNLLGEESSEK